MTIRWFALWFAVLGWDALLPHTVHPSPWLAIIALILAGILFSVPGDHRGRWFSPGLSIGLAIASGVTCIALPWPERLGFILVGMSSLIILLPRACGSICKVLHRGFSSLGTILIALAATSHLYRLAESIRHDLGFLSHPLALLYRALGVHAAADPPFVHIQRVGRLITFDASLEKIIGHSLALYLIAGLTMVVVFQGRHIGWRRLLVFLGCILGFSIVRILALGLVLDESLGPEIYWLRGWNMGTLLVLAGILALVSHPARRPRDPHPSLGSNVAERLGWHNFAGRRGVVFVALSTVFGLLIAASLGFFDPGKLKPGRVLVDERHSNWEWSTIELNTESYGVQTVYNYSELVRYLRHFYEVGPNFEPLTDSLLSSVDVVVLKTPTRPYADEEVEAVVRFVKRGGGLWLVGDHTNVFGMSTNLNKIARRFGLQYQFDALPDLETRGFQLFEKPRLFTHPSIAHLPPLLMATSCSLLGPPLGQRVMIGHSLFSDELDYSVNTFFGNLAPDPHESFGSMLQAMAVTYGKGRVLAFTDSTIFSNFFFFIRGKRELALGTIAWLMRENRWPWLRSLFLAAAALALLLWIGLAPRMPREAALASLGIGAAPAFALASIALQAWVAGWSALPEPHTPMHEVAFMRERCAFHIPERNTLPERSPHSFHTFYVWTQRVGYIPRTDSLRNCLRDADIVAIVNPRGPFSLSSLAAIEDYVRLGGGLLVLDRPYMPESTANDVLERFGLSFNYTGMDSVFVREIATNDSLYLKKAGQIKGGKPILILPDSTAVLAMTSVGTGQVVAMCAADNFTDAALGTTSQIPDQHQLNLYRLQFRIFDEFLRSTAHERPESRTDR